MRIEAAIAAFVCPRRFDLGRGVAEHGAKAMLDAHLLAEFLFDRVDARLRDVGLDAQGIRKILDLDGAHDRGLATRLSFGRICGVGH